MCTVSNVMDGFNDRWWPLRDTLQDKFQPYVLDRVSRAEFDKLREEVMALRDALKAAKLYDEKTGQPDCESEDKMAKLREICKLVGIDLDSLAPYLKASPASPAERSEAGTNPPGNLPVPPPPAQKGNQP